MQLAHHDAFGTVDDELATAQHDGDVAEVDLFLDGLLASEPQRDPKRAAIGQPQLPAFIWIVSRLAKFVPQVLDLDSLVVALDRKDLAEHALDAMILPLVRRHVVLQKRVVEPRLDLSQVGNGVACAAAAEVTDLGGLETADGASCHRRKAPERGFLGVD